METVYQPGNANNPDDLLQKLVAFLVANGWTSDMSAADGTKGWRAHLHRGSVYVNLRSGTNEVYTSGLPDQQGGSNWSGIIMYLGDGYASGQTWVNQSGGPRNATTTTRHHGVCMVLPQGAISAYHFFAHEGGDHITVVVEKTAGIFTHMGWGVSLQKVGAWPGGEYFYGATAGMYVGLDPTEAYPGFARSALCPGTYGDTRSNGSVPSTYVRVDVDAFTGKWVGIGASTSATQGYTGKIGYSCLPTNGGTVPQFHAPSYSYYLSRTTNALNSQSLLLPLRLFVERDTGGSSLLGAIPHVFVSNACSRGFTPGTVYPWGAENYMVFPGSISTPTDVYGVAGFAVRR